MRLCKFCRRNGYFSYYLLFFLQSFLIPDRMRVYKNKNSWVGRGGRLWSWPKNHNLQNNTVSSEYMCIFCESFCITFPNWSWTFCNMCNSHWGHTPCLIKMFLTIHNSSSGFLYKASPKWIFEFHIWKVCQQRLTALYTGVKIDTTFWRKQIC